MDGDLESSIARRLETLPEISNPVRIHRVSEGSEFTVWIVNSTHVLRLAKTPSVNKSLAREIDLLSVLTPYFDGGLIPPCLYHGRLDKQDTEYALYPRATGEAIEHAVKSVPELTVEGLAKFLWLLKEIALPPFEAIGVPEAEYINTANLRREALEAWIPHEELGTTSREDLERLLIPLEPCLDHPRVLLHNDLKGEHLFIEPSSGLFTGVIDWTDAVIGCPAWDIAGLVISVGARRAARAARLAGYSGVLQEGILVARCRAWLFLVQKLKGEDTGPLWLLKVQVQKAFEEY